MTVKEGKVDNAAVASPSASWVTTAQSTYSDEEEDSDTAFYFRGGGGAENVLFEQEIQWSQNYILLGRGSKKSRVSYDS